MTIVVLDARDHILKKMGVKNGNIKEKPAVLVTGAHHARELTSIQMPLYSLLTLI